MICQSRKYPDVLALSFTRCVGPDVILPYVNEKTAGRHGDGLDKEETLRLLHYGRGGERPVRGRLLWCNVSCCSVCRTAAPEHLFYGLPGLL